MCACRVCDVPGSCEETGSVLRLCLMMQHTYATGKPLIFQWAALARPKGAWPVVSNHRLLAVFSFSRR
jgi:hypothetical protein